MIFTNLFLVKVLILFIPLSLHFQDAIDDKKRKSTFMMHDLSYFMSLKLYFKMHDLYYFVQRIFFGPKLIERERHRGGERES